jgi:hypothetical protein
MLTYWHNGGNPHYQEIYGGLPGQTYLAMPGTPFNNAPVPRQRNVREPLIRDIILHSWWYQVKDTKGIIANAPAFYRAQQFNFVACAWSNESNILTWSQAIAENDGLGLVAATWNNNRRGVPRVAEYSWNSQLE